MLFSDGKSQDFLDNAWDTIQAIVPRLNVKTSEKFLHKFLDDSFL